MTDEQIEIAARELCKRRGLDPNEFVVHGPRPNADGTVHCIALHSPRWSLVVGEIRYHLEISEAIKRATEAK